MSKPSVYLAGPMRNYKLFNFPAFDAYTEKLREDGFIVFSPAELDRQNGFDPIISMSKNLPSPAECCLRDIDAIIASDAVLVMPKWRQSRGAVMEVAVAHFLDKPIYQLKKLPL